MTHLTDPASARAQLQDRREAELRAKREEEDRKRREEKRRQQEEQKRREEEEQLYRRKQVLGVCVKGCVCLPARFTSLPEGGAVVSMSSSLSLFFSLHQSKQSLSLCVSSSVASSRS